MTSHILAICGPKGSGKSTLANLLPGYVRTSFAYLLKKMLIEFVTLQGATYETAYEMFYGSLKDVPSEYFLGKTPVFAMQTLGTEWGRDLIHPNLWAEAWRKNAETYISEGRNIVVDDLRFVSEENVIRTFENTTIVRIDRPGRESSEHRSENEFLAIDYDIYLKNDKTLDEMFAALINSEVYRRNMGKFLRDTLSGKNDQQ